MAALVERLCVGAHCSLYMGYEGPTPLLASDGDAPTTEPVTHFDPPKMAHCSVGQCH